MLKHRIEKDQFHQSLVQFTTKHLSTSENLQRLIPEPINLNKEVIDPLALMLSTICYLSNSSSSLIVTTAVFQLHDIPWIFFPPSCRTVSIIEFYLTQTFHHWTLLQFTNKRKKLCNIRIRGINGARIRREFTLKGKNTSIESTNFTWEDSKFVKMHRCEFTSRNLFSIAVQNELN